MRVKLRAPGKCLPPPRNIGAARMRISRNWSKQESGSGGNHRFFKSPGDPLQSVAKLCYALCDFSLQDIPKKKGSSLDVEVLHVQRVVFDELPAGFDVFAHKSRKDGFG